MKYYNLGLSEELSRALEALAKAERRTVTEVIRIALETHLTTTKISKQNER